MMSRREGGCRTSYCWLGARSGAPGHLVSNKVVTLSNNPCVGRVVWSVEENLVCSVECGSRWRLHGVLAIRGGDVRRDVNRWERGAGSTLYLIDESNGETCGVAGDGIPSYGLGN
jgi:hypothetical protein